MPRWSRSRSSTPGESESASREPTLSAASERAPNHKLPAAVADLFEPLIGGGAQPDILAHLNPADLRDVLARGTPRLVPPKEDLFRQGDEHQGIYIIQSGLIRTYYTAPSGREITLAYWRAGSFVGGPDVFGGSIHMWSGMAMPKTRVFAFKGDVLRDLMLRYPGLAVGLVDGLVYKGRCFSSLIQILGTRSVAERLSQILLALCAHYGRPEEGGTTIDARFTHEDLAHMVGASRQWVTTTLDRLQKEHIVRIRKRQIVVLRPDLLRTGDQEPS